ncbi:6,7-dimethyl-8-ribityllumazine synthase [Acidobacteria bacterium AH-259-D05]|nr:6,7-dimethyl-8-ribityllumazine synthase [Acidobacteria bacterium AH-259-D05]
MKEFAGKIESEGLKIGIVVSRFNEMITERLLNGALDTLGRNGIRQEDITVVRVPGGFEIPLAAQRLAQTGKFDAIVCLGAVIRGETPHFEYISSQVTRGIGEIGLKYDLPVSFGVITADTVEQAVNRAGTEHGNKGTEAAISAVEMANLLKDLAADS